MIDTLTLLNDVEFAKVMLDKKELSGADIVFILRNLLRMKYYPVAIKFFYSEDELSNFKKSENYKIALHPFTFCHYLSASRQKGDILLGTAKELGCSNAKYVFRWKEFDEGEIKSHIKYAKDREQAERFVKTKKRLPINLLAFATAPLHKATFKPDVIHGISDVLQAYHIANDWCTAKDIHPFEMSMTMNSSACHGSTAVFITNKPNITPMCGGSYTSGKTEQGEINWIWPGQDIEPTIRWTLERTVRDGGVSYPRTGETYPGFNMCKLCPFLVWRNPISTRP
ncbi:MAG: DUF169 domain-containing protein [Desulfobacterales bacterium]|nr:DUF169 domain-containing protein [Desulfobacterales bacterium]